MRDKRLDSIAATTSELQRLIVRATANHRLGDLCQQNQLSRGPKTVRIVSAMSFSSRYPTKRNYPPRDVYEEAPERVRSLLNKLLQEDNVVAAYRRLCEMLGKLPDADIWSEGYASPMVASLVDRLDWWEVFDALEEVAEGRPHLDSQVNDAFARCGLAYEMVDGHIYLLDEEAEALEVKGVEHEAESLLDERFTPVRKQYSKALAALHGRPADLEKAVSESFGALEAVVRILTDEREFGKGIDRALAGRDGLGALAASIKSMYGYASQVPGARHGRHKEPDLTFAEAKYVVRTVGIAVAYLIESS